MNLPKWAIKSISTIIEGMAWRAYHSWGNKTIKHIKAQGYNNVESKLYPICRHEVFNEPRKQEYLQDMLEWLTKPSLKLDLGL